MDDKLTEQTQRREYSRVDAYLPFGYRIVAEEEKGHIQSRIAGTVATSDFKPVQNTGEHDLILGEWFNILNAKLDTVIRLMTLQREGYFGLPFKTVNISGGGISFFLTEAIPLGTTVEIKIMLMLNQPIALFLFGEVTKSEKKGEQYLTAVRYLQMDSIIRDEIIRYVFEREREIIREKRR